MGILNTIDRRTLVCIFSVLLWLSNPSLAKATSGVGVHTDLAWTIVDDEFIGHNNTVQLQPFNAFFVTELQRDMYLTTHIGWKTISTGASQGGVAQDIRAVELDLGLEYQWRLSKGFKPRLGAGVGYLNAHYSQRFTTDGDGYLLERFDDDNRNIFLVYLTAAHYWSISRQWNLGAHVRGSLPFSFSEINYMGIGLSALYRF